MPVVTKRQRYRNWPGSVKRARPSRTAARKAHVFVQQHNEGRGPDAENRQVHCVWCGAVVVDVDNLDACYFCNSDNYRGTVRDPGGM